MDYSKMLKADLQALADELGIEYQADNTKAELIELLS